MAIIAGLFYGVNFTPPQYLIDNDKGSSSGLDYVFSHFCGILLSSTFYFLVYCLLMRNKPKLYPEVIVPGVISGTSLPLTISHPTPFSYLHTHTQSLVCRCILGYRDVLLVCSQSGVIVFGIVSISYNGTGGGGCLVGYHLIPRDNRMEKHRLLLACCRHQCNRDCVDHPIQAGHLSWDWASSLCLVTRRKRNKQAI